MIVTSMKPALLLQCPWLDVFILKEHHTGDASVERQLRSHADDKERAVLEELAIEERQTTRILLNGAFLRSWLGKVEGGQAVCERDVRDRVTVERIQEDALSSHQRNLTLENVQCATCFGLQIVQHSRWLRVRCRI